MKTVEERATEYEESLGAQDYTSVEIEDAYFKGAADQKAIDIEKAKEWLMNQFPDTYTHDDVPIGDAFVKFMEE